MSSCWGCFSQASCGWCSAKTSTNPPGVSHALERLAEGSIAAFARSLGLPRGTVKHWCQGKRIPEMDMI
ncbi:MAG: hypothetical protein ACJ8CB_02345 [Ktedonobacteraceae bacterium]